MLDVKRLIGEVAVQHGIRLEPNDPAFALVTLNQLVLEETANRLSEQVSAILDQYNEALTKGEVLAGKTLAQEVRAASLEVRKEIQQIPSFNSGSFRPTHEYRWLAAGVLLGLALSAISIELYRITASW